jgi:hypothetical protein
MSFILPLAPRVLKTRAQHQTNLPTIMSAKKTAKNTAESSTPMAPTAKKATKKAARKTTAEKSAASKSPAPRPAAPKVTADTIARAAYLNYRRRVEQGLPGDSHGDWLEAERQLASGKI